MIELLNCDCMDYMASCPDKKFDLAIVDPPYGIGEDGRKTKGRTFRKDGTARFSIDKRNGRKSLIYNNYESKQWDNVQPNQIYFDELFRISKKQIIWGCNYINFNQHSESSGRIFWDKINGDNDFSDGELAWTNFHKSIRKIEFMWNGMLQGISEYSGRINQGNKKLCEIRIHPTQKPVALYRWLLDNYAKPGDLILDTHAGSFSSAVACKEKGFSGVFCELDKEYFDGGKKRVDKASQQYNLIKPEKKIYDQPDLIQL